MSPHSLISDIVPTMLSRLDADNLTSVTWNRSDTRGNCVDSSACIGTSMVTNSWFLMPDFLCEQEQTEITITDNSEMKRDFLIGLSLVG